MLTDIRSLYDQIKTAVALISFLEAAMLFVLIETFGINLKVNQH